MLTLFYEPRGILAATVQGAVFGGVRAAVDRGGASWFAEAKGTWPA